MTRFYPYTLTPESPLILTEAGGDPNSVNTLSWIPGSSLRGAAAAALIRMGMAPGGPDFESLILSGEVAWLPAYPLIGSQRSVPTPLSWRQLKSEGADAETLFDLCVAPGEEIADAPLVAVSRGGFVNLGDPSPQRFSPELDRTLHFQMDRERQRAWKGKGTVFAYESVAASQPYAGVLAIEGDSAREIEARFDTIEAALGSRIRLGRSRAAGYGGWCEVTWQPPRERELAGAQLASSDLHGRFRLFLTSDYVGRNSVTGAWDPGQFVNDLRQGLPGAKVLAASWATRLVGGFNRTWRMELPQAVALAAGSQLLMEASAPVRRSVWLELEGGGLGERRAEGFGRFVFLSDWGAQRRVPVASPAARSVGGAPPELVLRIEERIELARLLRVADVEAANDAGSAQNLPSPHLLARLRLPLGRRQNPMDSLVALVHSAKEKPRKKLQHCRMGSADLESVLREMPGRLSGWMQVNPGALSGRTPAVDLTEIRVRYAATLLQELSRRSRHESAEEEEKA